MTREEFINWLEKIGARYGLPDQSKYKEFYDGVYVFGKDAYDKKKAHPRKNKDLYVPYIRVSGFDSDMLYTRENGWCSYMCERKVKDIIMDYTGVEAA